MMPIVHFVGFRGEEYWSAVRIWGRPAFVHRRWDVRAAQEVMAGDIAVFARGCAEDVPEHPSFDDSRHM